jgi:hypothetical protein
MTDKRQQDHIKHLEEMKRLEERHYGRLMEWKGAEPINTAVDAFLSLSELAQKNYDAAITLARKYADK